MKELKKEREQGKNNIVMRITMGKENEKEMGSEGKLVTVKKQRHERTTTTKTEQGRNVVIRKPIEKKKNVNRRQDRVEQLCKKKSRKT